jgi:hypothetical protein
MARIPMIFYTIKTFLIGDLGLKNKLVIFFWWGGVGGSWASFYFWSHVQCTHQFLIRTLSARISSLCVVSACFEGTFSNLEILRLFWAYALETDGVCSGYASVPFAYAEGTHQFLTRMLSERISSFFVRSGYKPVPDAYVQHGLKGLCSVHALVPDTYTQFMNQVLTRMLSAHIVPDVYAQCMHQFLLSMLSACISSLRECRGYTKWTFEQWQNRCVCWACALGTDAFG